MALEENRPDDRCLSSGGGLFGATDWHLVGVGLCGPWLDGDRCGYRRSVSGDRGISR